MQSIWINSVWVSKYEYQSEYKFRLKKIVFFRVKGSNEMDIKSSENNKSVISSNNKYLVDRRYNLNGSWWIIHITETFFFYKFVSIIFFLNDDDYWPQPQPTSLQKLIFSVTNKIKIVL